MASLQNPGKYGHINDMRGFAKESTINKKIYEMWYGLVKRCNDSMYTIKHPTYEGVTCHSDFFLLSNFVKWIEKEPRYQEFCDTCETIRWCIDKDGIVPGNKEYTYGKMQLITQSENSREANRRTYSTKVVKLRNNPYIKEGEYLENIKKANEIRTLKYRKPIIGIKDNTMLFYYGVYLTKNDFNGSSITKCCRGERKTHKGFRWYYLTRLEVL